MFEMADKDSSGRVDFNEFKSIVNQASMLDKALLAVPSPVRRQILLAKTIIFGFLGLYTAVVVFSNLADSLKKHPAFTTEFPESRCVKLAISAAAVQANDNTQKTLAAYAVNAGQMRVAFCTDQTQDEIRGQLPGNAQNFDPLEAVTGGTCSISRVATEVSTLTQGCSISGTNATSLCSSIFAQSSYQTATSGFPNVIAWSWQMVPVADDKAKSSGRGPCQVVYTKNPDMPLCKRKYVWFFHSDNQWLTWLYVISGLYCTGLVIWEAWCIHQFNKTKVYGWLRAPLDGSLGAVLVCCRKLDKNDNNDVNEDRVPRATVLQWIRRLFASILPLVVALSTLLGCNFFAPANLKNTGLLLFNALKIFFDIYSMAVLQIKYGGAKQEDWKRFNNLLLEEDNQNMSQMAGRGGVDPNGPNLQQMMLQSQPMGPPQQPYPQQPYPQQQQYPPGQQQQMPYVGAPQPYAAPPPQQQYPMHIPDQAPVQAV